MEEELRESMERAFEAYGDPLGNLAMFKYMGRGMKAIDYDWPAVVGNLQKTRKIWGRLSRILSREGGVQRFWDIFQGGETVGVVVRGGDVGTSPQDGSVPDYFPTQGRTTYHQ